MIRSIPVVLIAYLMCLFRLLNVAGLEILDICSSSMGVIQSIIFEKQFLCTAHRLKTNVIVSSQRNEIVSHTVRNVYKHHIFCSLILHYARNRFICIHEV